jgi:beta-lactamase regulating signal transducer with metallopeptidase domain
MNAFEWVFRIVLEATWRMACIIAVFMALRFLLKGRVSPHLLYWAWIAVAIGLLVPFSVPAKWSPFNFVRHNASAVPSNPPTYEAGALNASAPPQTPSPGVPGTRAVPTGIARPSVFLLASCVWAAGVLVLLFARILAYRRFASRLGLSLNEGSGPLSATANEAASEFGERGVQVVLTNLVAAPALYGILRPKLLFPPDLLANLSPAEVRLIFIHELCHHRRRDLMSQAVMHAAQIVHWFNPIVWIAGVAARNDCEIACDADVVRSVGPTDSHAYGATLLKVAGFTSQTPFGRLGVGIVESKTQLKQRILMIIENRPSSLARSVLGWALIVLVAALGATRESKAQQPSASSPAPQTPATPALTEKAPPGWWRNGDRPEDYVVGIDPGQMHDGQPSAYVKSIVPTIPGFGGMMQMCHADKFIGKRLRYSAWMKTENVEDAGAHLWFRVDGAGNNTGLQFDNMKEGYPKGTTGWQLYSVVLDVPAESTALAFGFFIGGTGKAWVSGVKIEEVGLDVPSTNTAGKKNHELPDAPTNLGFSQ